MGDKICTECKIFKPLSQFDMKRGKPRSNCKACVSRYTKQHYIENKPYYIIKASINRKKAQEKLRRYLFDYKSEHSCVDCAETNAIVLEFDHVKGKSDGLAKMVTRALTLKTIIKEIAKCEVVCANCHRKRTAKRSNWYNRQV